MKSEELHQCQDYSTQSQVLWAQTCFCVVVHSFASHLSRLSTCSRQIDAPCSVYFLLVSQEGCAHKNSFTWAGFCFCFMWTSSRSKSVLLGKRCVLRPHKPFHAGVIHCAVHFRELLDLGLFICPFDTQSIVKSWLHYSVLAWFSYCLGCMAKPKVCIRSRGDWTNWKGYFYCRVLYAQKLCLDQDVP